MVALFYSSIVFGGDSPSPHLLSSRIADLSMDRLKIVTLQGNFGPCHHVGMDQYLLALNTILRGMNIHKSQLFWCEQKRGTIGFDPLPCHFNKKPPKCRVVEPKVTRGRSWTAAARGRNLDSENRDDLCSLAWLGVSEPTTWCPWF